LQQYNFTQAEHSFITRCLIYIGDACAKLQQQSQRQTRQQNQDIDTTTNTRSTSYHQLPIVVAWYKLKQLGWMPGDTCLSTYMYILSTTCAAAAAATATDSTTNSSNSSIELVPPVCEDTLLEVVTCHDWMYQSNEKTVSIRLKGLIGKGRVEEAEELLALYVQECDKHKQNSDGKSIIPDKNGLRLRTCLPLMEHYCQSGDVESVLRLYRQMHETPSVHWDAEAYTLVLSSLARFGYLGVARNITNRYGPELFETIVRDMAEDVLELSPEAVTSLESGFREGLRIHRTSAESLNDDIETHNSVIVERVEIPSNGTCPSTGAELRLLSLDESQRQHVHDTLLEMAKQRSHEFANNVRKSQENPSDALCSSNTESLGYRALSNFSEWLDTREGDPFTSIVDGANVAYYGHSSVHYSSLKLVVERLEEMGETPLVVMPWKYIQPSFYVSSLKSRDILTEKDGEVIQWLQEKEMMYVVPRLCLDDYFWMLASVSNQTNSRRGKDLSVAMDDQENRFAGMRPMLVTNDQMRDHKLDLLGPREFRRWYSCHIVNYHIDNYKNDEWQDERNVRFYPADYYSREIQGNAHPSGKGTVWHFPITNSSDWWLGIWIEQ